MNKLSLYVLHKTLFPFSSANNSCVSFLEASEKQGWIKGVVIDLHPGCRMQLE